MRCALALIMLGGTVAGCSDPGPKFPPACPQLSLLRDAADITRYAGNGRDIRDVTLDAQLTAVPASCTYDSDSAKAVRATLRVAMTVTRGPAATSRQLQVPYFVAVTNGSQVLDEQDYIMPAGFPTNLDTERLTSDPINLVIPVAKDKSAAAYQIYVGFRLTPDELAVNRARGPR